MRNSYNGYHLRTKVGRKLKRAELAPRPVVLFTDTQFANQRSVTFAVFGFEVVEQATARAYQLEQAAARMVVFAVGFKMLGEVGNALAQDCDLHFWRTRVAFGGCMFFDQRFFALSSNGHNSLSHNIGFKFVGLKNGTMLFFVSHASLRKIVSLGNDFGSRYAPTFSNRTGIT